MANKQTVKVTQPFHLTLEEAQKLFKEFKAVGFNIIVVGLNPISTTSLILNKKTKEDKQAELLKKGLLVISMGEQAKKDAEFKEGDLVNLNPQIQPSQGIMLARQRELIVKDVFPGLRKYTAFTIDRNWVIETLDIDTDELEEIEEIVDMDAVLDKENEYRNKIKK